MFQSVSIRVPATSANLGPGFDSLGVALTLYNRFTFRLAATTQITGCKEEYAQDNLTLRAFRRAAVQVGLHYEGVWIDHTTEVPDTRGLGSSSTCIVAGVAAAYALAGKEDDREAILALATEIEGHPDNVAPAVIGGMTVCCLDAGKAWVQPVPVQKPYRWVAWIPPFALSTESSRRVLPDEVSRQDAVANVSHVAMLMAAMVNGTDTYIAPAMHDCLHQPYRSTLIPHFDAIVHTLQAQDGVLGCYLSGAGPTIMCLMDYDSPLPNPALCEWTADWQVKGMEMDTEGFIVEHIA